ncbi:tyrosine-type recombinase/integrase [Spirosoma sp. HMF4905]|uniref:Tyrosine-type recombinase/integrase n=1 Tax=Spirosoma arboris TaxID=2682092 RepID=A0A7K1SIL6_9BACT|nr:site-specific integrase [Spirosoma arboris]MVM33650.1 tyrosine-type recombinase/integrase [Spirosoma arboris]
MTYNVELADKPGKSGLYHIMIRLHRKDHKPARIQLSTEIYKKYWNPEKKDLQWIRSTHLTAKTENSTIKKALDKIRETVEGYLEKEPYLSPKDCKLRYEASGSSTTYKELATKAVQRHDISQVTVSDTTHVLSGFLSIVGESVTIEQITPVLLQTYRQKLLEKGLKNSTINQYISSLRVIYEEVQQARGVSKREMLTTSPFLEIEKLNAKSANKGRLREKGLDALKEGRYTFYRPSVGNGKLMFVWEDWARWCWLASYFQAGMRVGDLLRSRYEWYELDDAGYPIRLRYQMQKNGRKISLKLSPDAIAHLKLVWKLGLSGGTYLLPFLDQAADYARYRTYDQVRAMPRAFAIALQKRIAARTGQLNRAIREVVVERGVEVIGGKLSNHSARHSVGDAAVRAMKAGKGVTIFDFQALFGHSSVKTSEIYRGELEDGSLDSAVDAVFGQ